MNFAPSALPLFSAKKLFSASTVARLSLSLLLGLALPTQASAQNRQETLPLPLNEVRMFTEALERIRMSYVEEVDDQTLLENAIRGMLAGLDPHSSYMAGEDFDLLEETTTGEFGGLGVEVGRENGYIRVISPIDDSPADRAGIKAGDLIIQIDSKPLREMLPEEAAQMMRGAPGTDVTVTVAREGQEPFDVTITREVIAIASVRSRMIAPGYAYLRISQFRVNTGSDLEEEIEELTAENEAIDQPIKGMVLDLRNNPGGILQASVGVVDAFINEGRIVYTEGRLEQTGLDFSATRKTVAGDVPLVVLINNGSASASEIVAGALQDHGRAIIMGTRSFGKGSVQTVLPLGERRAIKLHRGPTRTDRPRFFCDAQNCRWRRAISRTNKQRLRFGLRDRGRCSAGSRSGDHHGHTQLWQRVRPDRIAIGRKTRDKANNFFVFHAKRSIDSGTGHRAGHSR